jgi:hypothetical protein
LEDVFARIIRNLFTRLDGPLHLRLILQPTVAAILAIRDGLKDGRQGHPAYFWAMFSKKGMRIDLLRAGWRSVSKVFILACVLDIVYQIIVQRWVYPGEVLLVACILAFIPYLLIRGPVNRITRL